MAKSNDSKSEKVKEPQKLLPLNAETSCLKWLSCTTIKTMSKIDRYKLKVFYVSENVTGIFKMLYECGPR